MNDPNHPVQRSTFYKETLLKKLSQVVEKIPTLDLPAEIKAIYAFGGVLRDKAKLHDVDLVCVYSFTSEQKVRWDRFFHNFTDIHHGTQTSPLMELWPVLRPYHEKEISLVKAIEDEPVIQALTQKGVPPRWAACFSWTEIANNPYGLFFPYIEKVFQKLLLPGARGLSFIFVSEADFITGKSVYSGVTQNHVLAWSPEKPDIRTNLLGRTSQEKEQFLRTELAKFIKEIAEFKNEYTTAKDRLRHSELKLDFKTLEKGHPAIVFNTDETYDQLLEKCEQGRQEMRLYQEEIEVLKTIESALNRYRWGSSEICGNPINEQIAYLTLIYQPKQMVKEERIRQILRTLGLPEQKVKTKKYPGYRYRTEYELMDMIWLNRNPF